MSAHRPNGNSGNGTPNDSITLPEEAGPVSTRRSPPDLLSLVVLYCADEPQRTGEAALVPPGEPGPYRGFGRGGARAGDRHRRLELARHRPGGPSPAPPLACTTISREQLVLRSLDGALLEVTNIGQASLLHNGIPVSSAHVRAGDAIQLGRRLLLLCTRRPAWLPARVGSVDFPFGGADAHGIVGESAAAWRLREQIAFVARAKGHVLIVGPSGGGKELVANAIHALSGAARRPMVSRNAATLPESLIDAELFGNAKNYPNPGMTERPGLIGQADGSTLFLDEIAELPAAMQAHLLRVLDRGEYQRLGEVQLRTSQFRLIAATNRPMQALKHDLLARLVLLIEVPSLNQRREDIPLIAFHILRAMARDRPEAAARFFDDDGVLPRVSLELIRRLVFHPYISNVREVEAFLWKAVGGSQDGWLRTWDEADASRSKPPPEVSMTPPIQTAAAADAGTKNEAADDAPGITREKLEACLRACDGVQEKAWRALGLSSRHALARLMVKHGLHVPRSNRYGGGAKDDD